MEILSYSEQKHKNYIKMYCEALIECKKKETIELLKKRKEFKIIKYDI